MGKTSQEELWQRRVRILARVISERSVSVKELKQTWGISSKATLQNDIDELRSLGIPVELAGDSVVFPPIDVEALWRETGVGDRLQDAASMNSKECIAESVLDYLKTRGDSMRSVLIGTGVSSYKVAEAIYLHEHELHIEEIHSSSVLVLFAFAYFRPRSMTLRLAGGQLDRTTAWLEGAPGIEQLRDQPVDAVVTSFMHLSKRGFTTQQPYEVGEKLMNLLHANAKLCLIPMEWAKLAGESGNLVAPEGGKGEEALDFRGGNRTYVIFTDAPEAPENDKDRERFEILKHWEKKDGVEVVRVP